MESEIWKDIPGYEGEYQASTMGRIKSLGRKVRGKSRNGTWFFRRVPERILRPGKYCKSGHMSVVLRKGSCGSPVHQLIMRTFAGETPLGKEILHKNGNPKDNQVKNLQFGTRTENIIDVYAHKGAWRKLSTEDIDAIRFALHCGYSGVEVAKEFDVSPSTISKIKLGRVYWWHK